MQNKKDKVENPTSTKVEDPCIVCGKQVNWGVDGCPIAEKGKEMQAFMGDHKGMIHYACKK